MKELPCLIECIHSINARVQPFDIEVVIVANGSNRETLDYLNSLKPPYKYKWYPEPQGAPRAYNEGIEATTGDYVLLLNDDVRMLDDRWFQMLMLPFWDHKDNVGLTGPIKFSISLNDHEYSAFAFWCTMIKRDVFKKIGLLDEIFSPFGFEDIDFCIRASKAGFKLVQVPVDTTHRFMEENPQKTYERRHEAFPIWHRGSVSVDNFMSYDYQAKSNLEARNRAIIIERYG